MPSSCGSEIALNSCPRRRHHSLLPGTEDGSPLPKRSSLAGSVWSVPVSGPSVSSRRRFRPRVGPAVPSAPPPPARDCALPPAALLEVELVLDEAVQHEELPHGALPEPVVQGAEPTLGVPLDAASPFLRAQRSRPVRVEVGEELRVEVRIAQLHIARLLYGRGGCGGLLCLLLRRAREPCDVLRGRDLVPGAGHLLRVEHDKRGLLIPECVSDRLLHRAPRPAVARGPNPKLPGAFRDLELVPEALELLPRGPELPDVHVVLPEAPKRFFQRFHFVRADLHEAPLVPPEYEPPGHSDGLRAPPPNVHIPHGLGVGGDPGVRPAWLNAAVQLADRETALGLGRGELVQRRMRRVLPELRPWAGDEVVEPVAPSGGPRELPELLGPLRAELLRLPRRCRGGVWGGRGRLRRCGAPHRPSLRAGCHFLLFGRAVLAWPHLGGAGLIPARDPGLRRRIEERGVAGVAVEPRLLSGVLCPVRPLDPPGGALPEGLAQRQPVRVGLPSKDRRRLIGEELRALPEEEGWLVRVSARLPVGVPRRAVPLVAGVLGRVYRAEQQAAALGALPIEHRRVPVALPTQVPAGCLGDLFRGGPRQALPFPPLHLLDPEQQRELKEEAVDHLPEEEGLVRPALALPVLRGLPDRARVPDQIRELAECHRPLVLAPSRASADLHLRRGPGLDPADQLFHGRLLLAPGAALGSGRAELGSRRNGHPGSPPQARPRHEHLPAAADDVSGFGSARGQGLREPPDILGGLEDQGLLELGAVPDDLPEGLGVLPAFLVGGLLEDLFDPLGEREALVALLGDGMGCLDEDSTSRRLASFRAPLLFLGRRFSVPGSCLGPLALPLPFPLAEPVLVVQVHMYSEAVQEHLLGVLRGQVVALREFLLPGDEAVRVRLLAGGGLPALSKRLGFLVRRLLRPQDCGVRIRFGRPTLFPSLLGRLPGPPLPRGGHPALPPRADLAGVGLPRGHLLLHLFEEPPRRGREPLPPDIFPVRAPQVGEGAADLLVPEPQPLPRLPERLQVLRGRPGGGGSAPRSNCLELLDPAWRSAQPPVLVLVQFRDARLVPRAARPALLARFPNGRDAVLVELGREEGEASVEELRLLLLGAPVRARGSGRCAGGVGEPPAPGQALFRLREG